MDCSIILPVYNVENFLAICLDSLLKLPSENIEIIAVNDGSTDSSLQILKEYGEQMPNLKIITQPNKGLSAARNIGIKNAKGKFISFIDSDDFINPAGFLRLLSFAMENEYDILIGEFCQVDEYGNKLLNKFTADNIHSDLKGNGMDVFIKYHRAISSVVWRSIYKKHFLGENKLFFHEGIYYEDVEFTPIAFSCARNVGYSDVLFYYYRQRTGSIMTSKYMTKHLMDSIEVWKVLVAYSKRISDDSFARVMREEGFHIFLLLYLSSESTLSEQQINETRLLCNGNMFSLKYKILRKLYIILPNRIFYFFIKSIFKLKC